VAAVSWNQFLRARSSLPANVRSACKWRNELLLQDPSVQASACIHVSSRQLQIESPNFSQCLIYKTAMAAEIAQLTQWLSCWLDSTTHLYVSPQKVQTGNGPHRVRGGKAASAWSWSPCGGKNDWSDAPFPPYTPAWLEQGQIYL